MVRCVNEKCSNDPLKSSSAKVVTIDGDLACCITCKQEYEKQRDHFLNVTIHDDKKMAAWWRS